MMRPTLILVSIALLAGCGEKAQSINSSYKPDEKAWQSGPSPYAVKGYKAGDKAAWDTQMRDRIQTQNEYVRVQ